MRTIAPVPAKKLILVLGANDDQVLRTDTAAETHLKSWDADKFAEAMVMVAAREVLQRDDLTKIARHPFLSPKAPFLLSVSKAIVDYWTVFVVYRRPVTSFRITIPATTLAERI